MSRTDDLSTLFTRPIGGADVSHVAPTVGGGRTGASELGFHQGKLIEFNNETGENIVEVNGATLSNLPLVGTVEAFSLQPGDVVGVLRVRSQYFILGRIAVTGGDLTIRGGGIRYQAGPVPPTPTAPTVTPVFQGIKVAWDGRFVDGERTVDWARVEVHVFDTSGFTPGPETLRASIEAPEGGEVTVALPPEAPTQYVVLVSRSLAGNTSPPSAEVSGTPGTVEDFIGEIGSGTKIYYGPVDPANQLFFDGVDDAVQVPNVSGLLAPAQQVTWEIRFRLAGHEPYDTLMGFGNNDWDVRLDSTTTARCHWWDANGAQTFLDPVFPTPLDDGEWHTLALVWDGVNGQRRARLDGVQVYSATMPAGTMPRDMTASPTFWIGAVGGTRNMHGWLSEVRVWATARTDAEIDRDAYAVLTGSEPGLVALWRFDDGDGTTLTDHGPNGLHGTISGATWARVVEGELWYHETAPGSGEYVTERRVNGEWVPVELAGVNQAIAEAIAAQQTADSKVRIYAQSNQPSGTDHTVGDMWIDIDDGNRVRVWNGSAWVDRRWGNGSIEPGSLVASNVIATGTITTSLLAAQAVTADKMAVGTITAESGIIASAAIVDANIQSVTASKITAGTLSASVILSGAISTATSGARVEFTSSGIRAYNSAGLQTVNIASTGEVRIAGEFLSGLSTAQRRVQIQPASTNLAEIRFYPAGETTRYAFVNSFDGYFGGPSIGVNGAALSGGDGFTMILTDSLWQIGKVWRDDLEPAGTAIRGYTQEIRILGELSRWAANENPAILAGREPDQVGTTGTAVSYGLTLAAPVPNVVASPNYDHTSYNLPSTYDWRVASRTSTGFQIQRAGNGYPSLSWCWIAYRNR